MSEGTVSTQPQEQATAWWPQRRRFTAEEYHKMAEAGILYEDDRLELWEGEILEMAAIGSKHFATVNKLTGWMVRGAGERAIVSIQNPVRISPISEPEPDVVLLRPRADHYITALPGPEDVLLLIEVSDTTLAYDRGFKLLRYAAAGIPEVWIVDLEGERLLTYRDPSGGAYQTSDIVTRGRSVAPAAFPDILISVDELLG